MNARDRAFRERMNKMADPAEKTVGYESAEMVTVDGEVVPGSMRELSFQFDDGARTVTLPKSQCRILNGGKAVEMPLWLAKKKGLV